MTRPQGRITNESSAVFICIIKWEYRRHIRAPPLLNEGIQKVSLLGGTPAVDLRDLRTGRVGPLGGSAGTGSLGLA